MPYTFIQSLKEILSYNLIRYILEDACNVNNVFFHCIDELPTSLIILNLLGNACTKLPAYRYGYNYIVMVMTLKYNYSYAFNHSFVCKKLPNVKDVVTKTKNKNGVRKIVDLKNFNGFTYI